MTIEMTSTVAATKRATAGRPVQGTMMSKRITSIWLAVAMIAALFTPRIAGAQADIGNSGIAKGKPRIAILYNAQKKHWREFDYALQKLGWSADRYLGDAKEMQLLPGKLDNYDMLIIAPLFDLNGKALMPGANRDAYMSFIKNGGMIVVTDGSYSKVRGWLADIDPRFGGLESGKCNSSQWTINGYVTDANPPSPLRFFPFRLVEPNSWPHFLKPGRDTQWHTIARCSEGFPVTFTQKIGRGLVSISALRQASPSQFANFWATLQLTRAHITLRSFDSPDPDSADGTLRFAFADNPSGQSTTFIYEVVPEHGATERFKATVTGKTLELPYHIAARGAVEERLLLEQDGKETLLLNRSVEMPQLLTVTPPAYRGILSQARRLSTVQFGIRVAPDKEDLSGATIKLQVLDPNGKQVSEDDLPLDKRQGKLRWRQPIKLDQKLPAGDYMVQSTLNNRNGDKLAETETPFKILAPKPAQTIIDEDGTFLVNGKPFFPLGFYHVNPDDYKEVAALGINTVQFWTWHTKTDQYGVSRGLAAASLNGLKAIFELNHKSAAIAGRAVTAYGENPALLMWYGMDEPTEADYGMAATLRDTYHQLDPDHPLFAVSVTPDLFAQQSQFTDVFAIDPYGKPSKAAGWIPKAKKALDGLKPLVVVPGSFGKETPDEIRATAYIALAHDARGLIWYPWSDKKGVGAKYAPKVRTAIASVCKDVTELLPVLTAPVRVTFQSEDGKILGMYMQGRKRAIMLVNSTPEKVIADMRLPTPLNKVNRKMKDYFKKNKPVLEIKNGRIHLELEPYETGVYAY